MSDIDTALRELRDELVGYRDAAEAAEKERDEAVRWIGVVGEELVLAGYPGGDRTVTLANLRALKAEAARLREALLEMYRRTGLCHGAVMGYGCSSGFHGPKCEPRNIGADAPKEKP